jgi:hypothetical protein
MKTHPIMTIEQVQNLDVPAELQKMAATRGWTLGAWVPGHAYLYLRRLTPQSRKRIPFYVEWSQEKGWPVPDWDEVRFWKLHLIVTYLKPLNVLLNPGGNSVWQYYQIEPEMTPRAAIAAAMASARWGPPECRDHAPPKRLSTSTNTKSKNEK